MPYKLLFLFNFNQNTFSSQNLNIPSSIVSHCLTFEPDRLLLFTQSNPNGGP